jgi:hypothetical protein
MSCGTYLEVSVFSHNIYPQHPASAIEQHTSKKIQVARLMLPKTPDKASCAVKVCDKALSPKNTAADMSPYLCFR